MKLLVLTYLIRSRLIEQLKKQEANEMYLKMAILTFEKRKNYQVSLLQHIKYQSRNDISSDLTQSVMIRMDTGAPRRSIGNLLA